MKESEERANLEKGEMLSSGTFEFFVVNISSNPLTGTVKWHNSSRESSINVNNLQPGNSSGKQSFSPESGKNDYWTWSVKGGDHKLNCYDNDRYAVVVISDYGIGVLVAATSPDTWKW
jgi:hypothetical protein